MHYGAFILFLLACSGLATQFGDHSTPESEVFSRYVTWHNDRLNGDCTATRILLWTATAGLGDSVNALVEAFRLAVRSERLFFADWRGLARADALVSPGFQWAWNEFVFAESESHRCGLPKGGQRGTDRVAYIHGHIHTGHPLLEESPLYPDLKLSDNFLIDSLLKPSEAVQTLVAASLKNLNHGVSPIIGVQIRTGAADRQRDGPIPDHANFLSEGDERLFLERARRLVTGRFKAPLYLDAHLTESDSGPRVFLMTDAPELAAGFRAVFGARLITMDGPVAHTGVFPAPARDEAVAAALGLRKALAEWFVFRRAADVAVLTAWSLFGSTAASRLETVPGSMVIVDDSRCGKPGRKPCQWPVSHGRDEL